MIQALPEDRTVLPEKLPYPVMLKQETDEDADVYTEAVPEKLDIDLAGAELIVREYDGSRVRVEISGDHKDDVKGFHRRRGTEDRGRLRAKDLETGRRKQDRGILSRRTLI